MLVFPFLDFSQYRDRALIEKALWQKAVQIELEKKPRFRGFFHARLTRTFVRE